jgi:hypothetical protein
VQRVPPSRNETEGDVAIVMLFAGRTFNEDRALLGLQRQLALGANPVPDPPPEARSDLSAPTIKPSVAVALAALIAAVFVWSPGTGQNTN